MAERLVARLKSYSGAKWHCLGYGNTRLDCASQIYVSDRFDVQFLDDCDPEINWCMDCHWGNAIQERIRRRAKRATPPAGVDRPDSQMVLSEVRRALLSAFPDRWESLLAEVERRFTFFDREMKREDRNIDR